MPPPPLDLTIRSRRVFTPDERAAAVRIRQGRIDAVLPWDAPGGDDALLDLGEACLLPGLVDTHVHVNEPGRTHWEGFATATRAAAAGGVTTLVDMPLNSVPATTTVAALEAKVAAAERAAVVNVRFWGGVVPGNAAQLEPLARAGVLGFKCFMVPSGVDEFAHVGEADLRAAMPVIARLGLPLLAHAELPEPIASATRALEGQDPRRHATWLASRPPEAEMAAIRLLIRLARDTGCRVHIVHLAAAEGLSDLRAARAEGLPITVETCPHYLAFAAEEIADGATLFKCAPPIRDRAHREALWAGLRDGDIDLIASDHSPCPPEMKALDRGDFFAAWGGIASLELGLAVNATEARARGFSLADVVRWMSERPARLAGLAPRKGVIAAGADADLVVFDPDLEWEVNDRALAQRHPITPYAGRRLRGRVRTTLVGGVPVYERGASGVRASG